MITDKNIKQRKYKYVYQVRTDNLCYGNMLLGTYNNLHDAYRKSYYLNNAYGCCTIKKVREYL